MKVSVIMPVYNTKKFLKDAIESILNQTFCDFEFIIIDDCSNDWSFELCEKYALIDNRIKLYKNQNNMWISFTRNKLISLTNSNFILIQDSDDISFNNRLKLSYDFLQNNNTYWVVSWNNEIIDEQDNIIWYREYVNNIKNIILKKSPISQPSCMFRKDMFLEVWWYDKNLDYWEDYDLWLKFYKNWYKIKNLNDFLIKYRIRKWQTKSEKLKDTIKNTIFIQKRATREYKIKSSISDKIYIFLEELLIFLPNNLVLSLFKKLEYKKWK